MFPSAAPSHTTRNTAYTRHKTKAAAASRLKSAASREIAPDCPRPKSLKRRAAALASLEFYCKTYKPKIFDLPFSADHRKVIAALETTILHGGQIAVAMPRGSGKTSLCEAAAEWAILRGTRKFVLLVCATAQHAATSLQALAQTFSRNDELAADFPATCYPLRRLEGISQRRLLWQGTPIVQKLTAETLALPNLPPSPTAGSLLATAGLTGSIRGRKWITPDGRSLRPDLVIIDDPQTDQSAKSPAGNAQREALILQTVLGLAGPGKSLAAVMPCTVIEPDDLADRFLDHAKHPEWKGIRTKLVQTWPTDPKASELWTQYKDIRAAAMLAGTTPGPENDFYQTHRPTMDAGAVLAWPERHAPNELSALQNAYNLRFDKGDKAFLAEYQNDPLRDGAETASILNNRALATRLNGQPRHRAPAEAHWITAGIDVQQSSLWWVVAAWSAGFGAAILDYGIWPRQTAEYASLASLRKTLATAYPGQTLEDQIAAGLDALAGHLAGLPWTNPAGEQLTIGRTLIDCNWNQSESAVFRVCNLPNGRTIHATPSRGRFVGAGSRPMAEWNHKPGDLAGHCWRLPAPTRGEPRTLQIDVNAWKSIVADRLALPLTAAAAITLPGTDPRPHEMLCDHLAAEYRRRVTGRGRTIDEWTARPTAPDNHLWDALILSAVAASVAGCPLTAQPTTQPNTGRRRRGVRYA
jgi:hypothetical protein